MCVCELSAVNFRTFSNITKKIISLFVMLYIRRYFDHSILRSSRSIIYVHLSMSFHRLYLFFLTYFCIFFLLPSIECRELDGWRIDAVNDIYASISERREIVTVFFFYTERFFFLLVNLRYTLMKKFLKQH